MTTLLGDDELSRIKAECMDSVLDISAAPYFDIRAIYDVIQAHVPSSATAATTSATAVTAAGASAHRRKAARMGDITASRLRC